jgi:phosphopantetheine adenylyltransferase
MLSLNHTNYYAIITPDVLDELVKRMETVLSTNDFQKRLAKVENEIHAIEQKRNSLVDMRLEETIDKATYEKKYSELESVLEGLSIEREQLEQSSNEEINLEKRIEHGLQI